MKVVVKNLNRTIVECKDLFREKLRYETQDLNRTIVECKVILIQFMMCKILI